MWEKKFKIFFFFKYPTQPVTYYTIWVFFYLPFLVVINMSQDGSGMKGNTRMALASNKFISDLSRSKQETSITSTSNKQVSQTPALFI